MFKAMLFICDDMKEKNKIFATARGYRQMSL